MPIEEEGCTFLDLTNYRALEGVNPFAARETKLLYRECYNRVFTAIFDCDVGISQTGTPGIGKSVFLTFLLYELLRLGKTVFYRSSTKVTYKFTRAYQAKLGKEFDCATVRDNPNNWFLYDSVQPDYNGERVVLAACPKHLQAYRHFYRDSTAIYLPPWTLEELLAVRSAVHRSVDEEYVRLMYGVFGGVARIIFVTRFKYILNHFQELLKYCAADLEKMVADKQLSDWDKFSHLLLHVTPDSTLTSLDFDYATRYMEEYLKNLKLIEKLNAIATKMHKSGLECVNKSQQGYVFEMLCCTRMQYKGELKLTPYTNPKDDDQGSKHDDTPRVLARPGCKLVYYDKGQNLDQLSERHDDPTLFLPRDPRNPGFDAFFVVGNERFYLNATVGRTHKVCPKFLKSIKATEKPQHSLVFVVPPEEIATFAIDNADEASEKLKLFVAPFPEIPTHRAALDQGGLMERLLTYVMSKQDDRPSRQLKTELSDIERTLKLRYVEERWTPVVMPAAESRPPACNGAAASGEGAI